MKSKRRAKGFLAVLIGMLVIIGMVPAVASATDGEQDDRFSVKVNFITELGGNTPPGAQAFVLDMVNEDASEDCGVYFDNTAFELSGEGDHNVVLSGHVDTEKVTEENGWENVYEDTYVLGFGMSQQDLNNPAWKCSERIYTFAVYVNKSSGYIYTKVTYANSDVDISPATFKNTYTHNLYDVAVKKTDEKDKALEGAVFQLIGNGNYVGRVFEVKSEADGMAIFTVPEGTYTLSEKEAPEGYIKSDDTYNIAIYEGKVWMDNDYTALGPEEYSIKTFVNKAKPVPKKPEAKKPEAKKPEPKKPEIKKPEVKAKKESPKTGDNSSLYLMITIGLASCGLLLASRLRKNDK